jgi:hypothetical protein
MNRNLLAVGIASVALTLAFAAPSEAAAPLHHHYKLIDFGSFGGPTSSTQDELQVLNNRGFVAGSADTSVPNHPNPRLVFCGGAFIAHAFLWSSGVLHDLGSLPGSNTSNANTPLCRHRLNCSSSPSGEPANAIVQFLNNSF